MNRFENFKAGLIKDNPVFSLFLGICSTLAITTSVNNEIGMGVSVGREARHYRGRRPGQLAGSLYRYHCDFG